MGDPGLPGREQDFGPRHQALGGYLGKVAGRAAHQHVPVAVQVASNLPRGVGVGVGVGGVVGGSGLGGGLGWGGCVKLIGPKFVVFLLVSLSTNPKKGVGLKIILDGCEIRISLHWGKP